MARETMGDHLGRAIIPALLGTVMAGVAWWALAPLPFASRWSVRGLWWLIQSIYLFVIAAGLPNVAGLTVVGRWLPRRDGERTLSVGGRWLLIGGVYGVSILVVGLVVGFLIFLLPAFMLTRRGSVPFWQLIGTLLTIPTLYPVAAVGGIVSIAALIQSRH
jgi:hypothetical protein